MDEDNMLYSEAVKMLFKIMEKRKDILKVEFERENDSFTVYSKDMEHICFGSEFKK